jgi:dolichol-phosphate mannosyltransferase
MVRQDLLIFIPTYNERSNIREVIRRISALDISTDILCIDDNSPDGTGALLDELAEQRPGMVVIHRPFKQGIGSAHLEALRFAYNRHYRRLITMDADLTHAPEDIPRFLEQAETCEVVIGNRFLSAATDQRKAKDRWLSRLSHWATKQMLKLPYDMTNAYRLYCIDKIDPLLFPRIGSHGYAFFFESLLMLYQSGISIKEIPIHIEGRSRGQSKRFLRDILEWLKTLMMLRLRGSLRKDVV